MKVILLWNYTRFSLLRAPEVVFWNMIEHWISYFFCADCFEEFLNLPCPGACDRAEGRSGFSGCFASVL